MRVLIVSKAFVNQMYRQKLTELGNLGVDVVAVTPNHWREAGSTQRLERGTDQGYQLEVLPMRWNGHFHIHYYAGLAGLVRVVRPDLVHMDEEPFNLATFLGVLDARRRGIPSLFFTWQNILRWYPVPFRDMERAVYRWTVGAIAGNHQAEQVLRAKGYCGPSWVIPQFGVDPDRFSPRERGDGPFTVGLLNRLIPAKAPILAVRAFTALPSDSRLHIVGDGPLRNEVLSEARALGVADRVQLQQRVPSSEVPQLLRSLDVVVVPSLTTASWKEQFGRVLIEAMASGVLVIGSSSGEIPNVIGDAGIVVPEANEQALAAALIHLHDDAALRKNLSQRGRARVLERFTHARIAEDTLSAYHHILGA